MYIIVLLCFINFIATYIHKKRKKIHFCSIIKNLYSAYFEFLKSFLHFFKGIYGDFLAH